MLKLQEAENPADLTRSRTRPRALSHARVAIAHDYLTTVGGAERVVLSLLRAFPDAPLFTSLYEPDRVMPELASGLDIHVGPLNQSSMLRKNYRAAMPLLGAATNRVHVDADVVLCSSSGWAHGISTSGRKVVYCYNPARWIYQRGEYAPMRKPLWWLMAAAMHPYLVRWDRKAARSCNRYIAISSIVARRIKRAYGVDATVLPPPTTLDASGRQETVDGIEPGYILCVGRLVPHKNLGELTAAFAEMPEMRLVVVGDGPERERLVAGATRNVTFTERVSDEQLRWLYANCQGLVSASPEDFGLTPLEAATFGKPAVLLRFGGFLDTMREGETAVFFGTPQPPEIVRAVRTLASERWDTAAIEANAGRYSPARFEHELQTIIDEELRAVR